MPRASAGKPPRGRLADFLKLEGAGNDFVLLDGREQRLPRLTPLLIRRLLDRQRGVGGDGLLVLGAGRAGQPVRVQYWNADGGAAAFCGNGARCVALLLLQAVMERALYPLRHF